MSAFVCSDLHINTLVTWAIHADVSYYADGWNDVKKDPARVAGILYTANVEAVNTRYNEDEDSSDFRFQRAPLIGVDPVWILKLCNCYDYQACELEGYEKTLAWKIINSIKEAAIRKLPGYDDAPWGI